LSGFGQTADDEHLRADGRKYRTCSRSRTRRGSENASALLSMVLDSGIAFAAYRGPGSGTIGARSVSRKNPRGYLDYRSQKLPASLGTPARHARHRLQPQSTLSLAPSVKWRHGNASRGTAPLRAAKWESVVIPTTSDRTLHPRNTSRTLSTTH
jgi:hypothetical protein